jgi:hypothetical protein
MCKSKGIQEIITAFSERLNTHLKKEFNKNDQGIERFMKETRAPD